MNQDQVSLGRIQTLRRDLIAGLTVATVAVPQGIAYALIAGVDPIYGLFTAIVVTILGSIFGSSSHLINGPTNAISIVVLGACAGLDMDPTLAVFLLAMLVGVTQILIALLKLGDLTRYVSESVILGFMAGAGVLIVLSQIPGLLGTSMEGDRHGHFLYRLWQTLSNPDLSINARSLIIGAGTVLLIIGFRRLSHRLGINLPDLLLALLLMAVLVSWLEWRDPKNLIVVPSVLPTFQLPKWEHLNEVPRLASSALAISVLGLLEALAIAKSISARTREPLDYNRQCLAEGLANLGGGLFQCMPGSGSLTRSAINYQAGAVTRWSGIISAIVVAIIVLLFGRYAAYIPRPALAGLLLVTAWRLVDRARIRYCWRAGRFDAILSTTTALSVVLISVEYSILIGTFLSFLMMVPRMSRLQYTELVVSPDRVVRERVDSDPTCDRIAIVSLEGELFFGVAPELVNVLNLLRQRVDQGAKVLLLRLRQARNPDMVCMELLQDFLQEMQSKKVAVLLCGPKDDLREAMRRLRFHHWLPSEWIFADESGGESATILAVRYAYTLLGDDLCSTCPKRSSSQSGESWYYMI